MFVLLKNYKHGCIKRTTRRRSFSLSDAITARPPRHLGHESDTGVCDEDAEKELFFTGRSQSKSYMQRRLSLFSL